MNNPDSERETTFPTRRRAFTLRLPQWQSCLCHCVLLKAYYRSSGDAEPQAPFLRPTIRSMRAIRSLYALLTAEMIGARKDAIASITPSKGFRT